MKVIVVILLLHIFICWYYIFKYHKLVDKLNKTCEAILNELKEEVITINIGGAK